MTVRTPLTEVLNTPLLQPTVNTLFIVSAGGVEQSLTVEKAGLLLAEKGAQGVQGRQGPQGTQGRQGTQGTIGSQGTNGNNGNQGATGTQGTNGNQGTTGVGNQGATGATSLQGATGTQGLQGRQGIQGTIGSGNQGATGNQGTSGSVSGNTNTASNLAGGTIGSIPIQQNTSSTGFISPGANGTLLQYVNSTATWVSTSSLMVNKSVSSDQNYVTILPVVGRTGDQYLTMVNGGNGYYSAGIDSNITYNVTNKKLTISNVYISSSTIASSTITGALVVAGGTGIGGNLHVGGNFYSTGTSYLKSDVYVGGTIYGTFSGSISSASNLAGGAAGKLLYQTALNTTGFVDVGTTGYVLTANNTAAPTWKNTTTLVVGYAVSVLGGAVGSVLFQTAANSTGKLVLGSPGEVLTVNPGGTAPYWAAATGGGGGGASDTATTATNLAGGLPGKIPYQTSAGKTGFTAVGSTGQVLTSGGSGSPTWTAISAITGITTATNLANGTSMSIVYQSSPGATAFLAAGVDGQILQTHGTGSVPTWTSISAITGITTATNLANGAAGSIPIQSEPGITTFVNIGTNGYVLTSNGTTAAWSPPAAPAAVSATTATNLANGTLGQVPYQSGVGATSFFGPGTLGQLLVSQGAAAPVYTNTSSIRVGFAKNLLIGTAGQIPYQTAPGATSFFGPGTAGQLLMSDGINGPYFTGPGTAGQLLVSQGAAAPQYTNTSSITVGFAAYAVLAGALVNNSIGYASSAGYSQQVQTTKRDSGTGYYPTFVQDNNTSATAETVYTSSNFKVNPSTGALTSGAIEITQVITAYNPAIGIRNMDSGNIIFYDKRSPDGPSNNIFNYNFQMDAGQFSFNFSTTDAAYDTGTRKAYIDYQGNFDAVGTISAGSFKHIEITEDTNNAIRMKNMGSGEITFYDSKDPDNGIYNYRLRMDSSKFYFDFSTVNSEYDGGSPQASIDYQGNIVANGEITAYGTASDIRLKENIVKLEGSLSKIEKLNGYNFNYIGEEDKLIGVIAQEVEQVVPELVYEFTNLEGEMYKAVRYEHISALLIEAVKELRAEINEIKKKIG